MVTRERAIAIAFKKIVELTGLKEDEILLNEEEILDPCGWLFRYQSKQFLETNDPRDALFGNVPVFVLAKSGETFVLGQVIPVEWQLSALSKTGELDFAKVFAEYREFVEHEGSSEGDSSRPDGTAG